MTGGLISCNGAKIGEHRCKCLSGLQAAYLIGDSTYSRDFPGMANKPSMPAFSWQFSVDKVLHLHLKQWKIAKCRKLRLGMRATA